jgi:sterol desaturase/sphingolipid hydroxylase (fatty acid hydroxylase superfamily)
VPAKKTVALTGFLVFPALFGFFYALRILTNGQAINHWLPGWYPISIIVTLIVLERLYKYRDRVSQKAVLVRDLLANLTNLYATDALASLVLVPIFIFLPQHLWGRLTLAGSPGQLGPLWLQIPAIMVMVSFLRYWIHRWQHQNEFLWRLHSYHHRITDVQALNGFVSHPIDFALRNALVFLCVDFVGFHPLAMLIAIPATLVSGFYSHCGADMRMGFLNYLFVTPEVHRWHHSAEVPEGRRYSVNYGVEFSFWDIVFGTFHLPHKDGYAEQPRRIGHPDGLPDERNYLRLLLAPLGLYPPFPWLKRMPGAARTP